jgi:hypothetical protein
MSPRPTSERGQALAETALFLMLAVMLAWGMLALIPFHRARSAAISAAYSCAQFLSQSPEDPARAVRGASALARATLDSDWSAARGVRYVLEIHPPAAPGGAGSCRVSYQAPVLFMASVLRGTASSEQFQSRSEIWKAKWR